jgi:hypothetical protein
MAADNKPCPYADMGALAADKPNGSLCLEQLKGIAGGFAS